MGCGFEYLQSTDPFKALGLAYQEKPELVIADIKMPGLSGIGLAKQIRENKDLSSTGVLLISSDASFEKEALEVADAFITKPIDTDELAREATRIVSKYYK